MNFKSIIFLLLLQISIIPISNGQNYKFIVMTDCRGDYDGVNAPVLEKFVNYIAKNHSDIKFVLFPGDLANGDKYDTGKTVNSWRHWKEIMKPIYELEGLIPPKIFVTVGNHEIQNRYDEKLFEREFSDMPQNGPFDEKGKTYSFSYGKAHFVLVNSNRWYYGNPGDTTDDRRDWRYIKHLDWLEKDLSEARKNGSDWIFVLGHEPAFPIGGHLRDCLPNLTKKFDGVIDSTRKFYLERRDKFWDILKTNNVAAYVCGHEHLYGRQTVDGVYQITAGSSGAPLYNFNPVINNGINENKAIETELSYEEAIPFYTALNYNYGKKGNGQRSDDFKGYIAFHFILFEVSENEITAKVIGGFPDMNTNDKFSGEMEILDTFSIKRRN